MAASSGKLYGRTWAVTIGRPLGPGASDLQELLHFTGLRTVFKIERSHTPDPNAATIQVYNLSEATRTKLASKELSILLEAGYVGHSGVILRGDISRITHQRDGADWATTIEAGDGVRSLGQARVSATFPAGVSLRTVMQTLAQQLGIGLGNSSQVLGELDQGETYSNGVAFGGRAVDALDQVARKWGLDYSVQNNELKVTAKGQPTKDEAVVLSASSGLVGSPKSAELGAFLCKALIVPGLDPGRAVRIQSRTFNGYARIDKTKYTGDSHGNDWYAELETKPL